MFDTMTLTKAGGAVCGALLVYLLAGWAGEAIYTEPHVYGKEHAQAYFIDTGAEEAPAADTATAEVDFATIFASADAAAGEKVFAKCKSCHKVDGSNGVGPHLNGVVGRNHAGVSDYAYSEANLALAAEIWSPEALNGFLVNPKEYMPGTKMSFAGLPKPEDRANVIAYLAAVP